jgi:P-type Ca2+ transporter type 2C
MSTEVGHISGMLSGVEQEKTPFTKQLDQITVLITIMAAAALVLIVILGGEGRPGRRGDPADVPRVAEVPFDAEYKRMATFQEMEDRGRQVVRCFVKGAPDVLLARSTHYLDEDGSSSPPLVDGAADRALAENDRMPGEGVRVLAVARRDFDPASFDRSGDLLELVSDLEFLALVGIVDPPRKEAKDAILLCKDAGIRVRMITGEHETPECENLPANSRIAAGVASGAVRKRR